MNKILYALMAVLTLVAVIDCKVRDESGTNQSDLCSIVGCVNEQNIVRHKRARPAVEILGGVEKLVIGILDTAFGHIKQPAGEEGEEIVIIGGGSYNDNTVVLDDSDYE